jgi:hypothetical protein
VAAAAAEVSAAPGSVEETAVAVRAAEAVADRVAKGSEAAGSVEVAG